MHYIYYDIRNPNFGDFMSALKILEELEKALTSSVPISMGVVMSGDNKILVENGDTGTRLPTAKRNMRKIDTDRDALSREVKKYGIGVGRSSWKKVSSTGKIPNKRYGFIVITRYDANTRYDSRVTKLRGRGRWASRQEVYEKTGYVI